MSAPAYSLRLYVIWLYGCRNVFSLYPIVFYPTGSTWSRRRDVKWWTHPVSSWFSPQRVCAIEGYMKNNVLILPGVSTYRKSVILSGSCKMAYWPNLIYWLTGCTWSGHMFTCWEVCWWCLIILFPTGCTWAQQIDTGRYTHGVPYFRLQIVSDFIG